MTTKKPEPKGARAALAAIKAAVETRDFVVYAGVPDTPKLRKVMAPPGYMLMATAAWLRSVADRLDGANSLALTVIDKRDTVTKSDVASSMRKATKVIVEILHKTSRFGALDREVMGDG